jgi:hypothetical protein
MPRQTNRRIAYAMLTIEIQEERKAAVDVGPLPIGTQLRNALVDGWNAAVTSALDMIVLVARVAPVLLVWTLVLAGPAWAIRRRFAK